MHRLQTQHTCPTLLYATLAAHSRNCNLLLPCLQQRTCVPCLSLFMYTYMHTDYRMWTWNICAQHVCASTSSVRMFMSSCTYVHIGNRSCTWNIHSQAA